jgi:hypothetical protein
LRSLQTALVTLEGEYDGLGATKELIGHARAVRDRATSALEGLFAALLRAQQPPPQQPRASNNKGYDSPSVGGHAPLPSSLALAELAAQLARGAGVEKARRRCAEGPRRRPKS